jgi:hypothetical protein
LSGEQQMKTFKSTAFAILAIFMLYLFGYWVFIKKDLVYYLRVDNKDPFTPSAAQSVIRYVFESVQELDLRLFVDAPVQRSLVGDWKSETNSDFISITPSHECDFRLGKFAHEEKVEYKRDYAGFYTEFLHEGHRYVFIFSPADWNGSISSVEAYAFIGHDPNPGFRETDYEVKLTKRDQPQ